MALVSMTGFGRASGDVGGQTWVWEVRSVNSRSLDVRLRLPTGWDGLETEIKSAIGKCITRGSVNATLTLQSSAAESLRINPDVLKTYVTLSAQLQRDHALAPPTTAEVLALKGVLECSAVPDEEALTALRLALLTGLQTALEQVHDARKAEGARLADVLAGIVGRIESLCREAEQLAASQPEVQRAKLTERLEELLAGRSGVDAARLEQEVALLALRADVREELDRLSAHIEAARELMAKAEPVGRSFDFLAQEFNREANTLCSKSATPALTRLGLDLKALIDQLREQVQNVE